MSDDLVGYTDRTEPVDDRDLSTGLGRLLGLLAETSWGDTETIVRGMENISEIPDETLEELKAEYVIDDN